MATTGMTTAALAAMPRSDARRAALRSKRSRTAVSLARRRRGCRACVAGACRRGALAGESRRPWRIDVRRSRRRGDAHQQRQPAPPSGTRRATWSRRSRPRFAFSESGRAREPDRLRVRCRSCCTRAPAPRTTASYPPVNLLGNVEARRAASSTSTASVNVSQQFFTPFGAQPATLDNATDNRYTTPDRIGITPVHQGRHAGRHQLRAAQQQHLDAARATRRSTRRFALHERVHRRQRRAATRAARMAADYDRTRRRLQRPGRRTDRSSSALRRSTTARPQQSALWRQRRLRGQRLRARPSYNGRDLRRWASSGGRPSARTLDGRLGASLLRPVLQLHVRPPHAAVGLERARVAQHHDAIRSSSRRCPPAPTSPRCSTRSSRRASPIRSQRQRARRPVHPRPRAAAVR